MSLSDPPGRGARSGPRLNGAMRRVEALRTHPRQLAIAAVVVGLVAGPRAPVIVLIAALVMPLLAAHTPTRLALVAAVVAGAIIGQARMHAFDATRLVPRFGHAATERVVLLDTPRRAAYGARSATVALAGERVLVRAPRGIPWPSDRVGAILRARGGLEPLPAREAWRHVQGVHAQLRAQSLVDTGEVRGGLVGWVDGIRVRAQRALTIGLPPPQAALLRGMALGDDAALPDGIRDELRVSGLTHLVAASGQNVMLLAALALAVAALVGLGLRARLVLVLVLIAVYVPLAGAGPSIQRAGAMGAAGVISALAGRPAARWHALLLAAGATLLLSPRAVEDIGWQLSFAAVVAILLIAPRMREGLAGRGVPRGLAEATSMTAAATLGTAPLIALHFGQSSLAALPANVLAAPAVAPVMWLGMVAATFGQLSAAAAAPCTALAGFPVAYVMWVGHLASGLPGARAGAPTVLVTAACVLVAAIVTVRRRRRRVLLAAALALGVAALFARPAARALAAPDGVRITFLDVGQGDATLIQQRRRAVLVDTGPPDGPVLARLRHAGVSRLDLLVVTHAQADHDGGAAAVIASVPVATVLDGRDGDGQALGARMATEANRRRVRLVVPRAGDVVRLGAIAVHVLWPPSRPAAPLIDADPNQRAVVAEVDAGGARMLLTSDAESDVLAGLRLRPVDVLKVAHHGSADPGLPALLARLRPRLAAIEVGRHNSYGHPAKTTIRALRAAGARILRTDLDGTIRVDLERNALRVHAHA